MTTVTRGPNLDWTPISPADLHEMELLDDVSAAQRVTARASFIDSQTRSTFMEAGMLADFVERRRLYQCVDNPETGMPCQSQNEWISAFCPFSRSTWFDAKKRWKELADIPAADRVQMPRSNVLVMQSLSTAVRKDPAVIQAAKNMSADAFRQKIETEHPEQCIETQKPMHLKPEKSQAKVIDAAVDRAIQLGAHSREEAFEMMAVEFLSSHPEEEEGAA